MAASSATQGRSLAALVKKGPVELSQQSAGRSDQGERHRGRGHIVATIADLVEFVGVPL